MIFSPAVFFPPERGGGKGDNRGTYQSKLSRTKILNAKNLKYMIQNIASLLLDSTIRNKA